MGFSPETIVFDSPAKTLSEIRYALQHGVHINVDNFEARGPCAAQRPTCYVRLPKGCPGVAEFGRLADLLTFFGFVSLVLPSCHCRGSRLQRGLACLHLCMAYACTSLNCSRRDSQWLALSCPSDRAAGTNGMLLWLASAVSADPAHVSELCRQRLPTRKAVLWHATQVVWCGLLLSAAAQP